jgi:glycosyltransferase involved in cell wall biosynthesis
MIKVVHIIGSKQLGGAERFYLRLVQALQKGGQTTVAFLRRGSEVVREVPPEIPVIELPMRTVWDPLSKWEVRRAIARVAPNIVLTYMGRATRLTHIRPGGGIVHVSRLGGYYKLDGYRHAHAWIGNTRGLCGYMIEHGLPASRVYHIYNFIDFPPAADPGRRAAMRTACGLSDTDIVMVTAGRFVEVKGHRDLLAAFARLPASLDDRTLKLLMVGDGILGDALRHQAKQLAISDRIVWAGWQTEPGGYYDMADLVVFPSLERETLGNVILEAWAHRRPLVTTLSRGAREITRHGEDAWCVPCNDPAGLAEGIMTVLNNKALRAAMVDHGEYKVRNQFGQEAIVNQYSALFDRLLARSATAVESGT